MGRPAAPGWLAPHFRLHASPPLQLPTAAYPRLHPETGHWIQCVCDARLCRPGCPPGAPVFGKRIVPSRISLTSPRTDPGLVLQRAAKLAMGLSLPQLGYLCCALLSQPWGPAFYCTAFSLACSFTARLVACQYCHLRRAARQCHIHASKGNVRVGSELKWQLAARLDCQDNKYLPCHPLLRHHSFDAVRGVYL